jgi:hypothetical protein
MPDDQRGRTTSYRPYKQQAPRRRHDQHRDAQPRRRSRSSRRLRGHDRHDQRQQQQGQMASQDMFVAIQMIESQKQVEDGIGWNSGLPLHLQRRRSESLSPVTARKRRSRRDGYTGPFGSLTQRQGGCRVCLCEYIQKKSSKAVLDSRAGPHGWCTNSQCPRAWGAKNRTGNVTEVEDQPDLPLDRPEASAVRLIPAPPGRTAPKEPPMPPPVRMRRPREPELRDPAPTDQEICNFEEAKVGRKRKTSPRPQRDPLRPIAVKTEEDATSASKTLPAAEQDATSARTVDSGQLSLDQESQHHSQEDCPAGSEARHRSVSLPGSDEEEAVPTERAPSTASEESEASPDREPAPRKPRTVLEPDDSTDFSEIESQVRNWTIRLRRKSKAMGSRAAAWERRQAGQAASSSAVGTAGRE